MSIITVEAKDAAAELPRLIESVEGGDEVVIERDGRPVARLVPERRTYRRAGFWKGVVEVSDDFDDPLPPGTWGDLEDDLLLPESHRLGDDAAPQSIRPGERVV